MVKKSAIRMIYSLTDPEFLNDPAVQLAQMRAEGPLVRVKLPFVGQIWMTTTDATARRLLKSPDLFRRDPEPITGKTLAHKFWWMPGAVKPLLNTMIMMDDPAHRRQRRLVELAFARNAVEDLRPQIEAMADGLLDALPSSGPVDIVAGYTRKLPFLAICALLGVPKAQHESLARKIAPFSAVANMFKAFIAMFGLKGVHRDFQAMFAEARARAPGPGLISALIHAKQEDDSLSEDEILSVTMLLFMAGHETTVHLINSALVTLAGDDALRAHFMANPEARALMIEEFMRFCSPVMMTKPMFAAEDTDMFGAMVKKGDMIAAGLIGANHDPTRVDAPHAFHPTRRPNAHLGFGHGPHVCLGMQLARIEAAVALDRLFARYPDFVLAGPPGWLKRPGIRAPAGVKLHLRP